MIAKRHLPIEKINFPLFLYHFVGAVIGETTWKQTRDNELLSEVLTPTDEVYLYLVLENSCERWLYYNGLTVSLETMTKYLTFYEILTNYMLY